MKTLILDILTDIKNFRGRYMVAGVDAIKYEPIIRLQDIEGWLTAPTGTNTRLVVLTEEGDIVKCTIGYYGGASIFHRIGPRKNDIVIADSMEGGRYITSDGHHVVSGLSSPNGPRTWDIDNNGDLKPSLEDK